MDACASGVGSVLQVRRKDVWLSAAFYSQQTRGPEKKYSATDLEALAVVESITHFSSYLYGKGFDVFADHKTLCSVLTSSGSHLNLG